MGQKSKVQVKTNNLAQHNFNFYIFKMPANDINLLPKKDFDRNLLGRFLRWSLTYGRYIIVCTEIIVLLAFIYRFSLDRQITDLNENVDQKAAIVEANLTFEHSFRNLQLRTERIAQLLTNQGLPVKVLLHLQEITPKGIIYSNYVFADNSIRITAVAETNLHLALFLQQLKNSPLLTLKLMWSTARICP